jgi:hypothetical protein
MSITISFSFTMEHFRKCTKFCGASSLPGVSKAPKTGSHALAVGVERSNNAPGKRNCLISTHQCCQR